MSGEGTDAEVRAGIGQLLALAAQRATQQQRPRLAAPSPSSGYGDDDDNGDDQLEEAKVASDGGLSVGDSDSEDSDSDGGDRVAGRLATESAADRMRRCRAFLPYDMPSPAGPGGVGTFVRLSGGTVQAGRLRSYRRWPAARVSVGGEPRPYAVGMHPTAPGVRSIGVVTRRLTGRLVRARFPSVHHRGGDGLYLFEDEWESCDAEARALAFSGDPVRLRAEVPLPAFGMGTFGHDEIFGLLHSYDRRNGTVAVLLGSHYPSSLFRAMLCEVERLPPQACRLPWPLAHFRAGAYVRYRAGLTAPRHPLGMLDRVDRSGRVYGHDGGGALLVRFGELNVRAAPEDVEIACEAVGQVGRVVRVAAHAPAPALTRVNRLWPEGVGPRSEGRVLYLRHDGTVCVDFGNAVRERYQVYHASELASGAAEDAPAGLSPMARRGSPARAVVPVAPCRCPITLMHVEDPVVAGDGETYEREAWEAYVDRRLAEGLPVVSPMTNEVVPAVAYPNRAMLRTRDEEPGEEEPPRPEPEPEPRPPPPRSMTLPQLRPTPLVVSEEPAAAPIAPPSPPSSSSSAGHEGGRQEGNPEGGEEAEGVFPAEVP
ncbi:MAG: hypothetical protein VYE81_03065 [Planctomycetota bacterium]|nr:hypothetical protein [Planctomycetota bacterium]